jgi:hypothetical protein
MSEQTNLEIMKEAYAAFGRGDTAAVLDSSAVAGRDDERSHLCNQSDPCRGKDDARDIRRRIRGLCGTDKAARARNLVIGRALSHHLGPRTRLRPLCVRVSH